MPWGWAKTNDWPDDEWGTWFDCQMFPDNREPILRLEREAERFNSTYLLQKSKLYEALAYLYHGL